MDGSTSSAHKHSDDEDIKIFVQKYFYAIETIFGWLREKKTSLVMWKPFGGFLSEISITVAEGWWELKTVMISYNFHENF